MKTMTLRNVPDEVVRQLAATAKEQQQSLNATAIQALRRSVGLARPARRKRDLTAFCGDWTTDEAKEFDRAVALFEELDAELWEQ